MKVCVGSKGQSRAAEVTRRGDRLTIQFEGAEPAELRLLFERDGRIELEREHRRIHVAGVARGGQLHVWISGRTMVAQCEAPGDEERATEASLASPLPAVVLEVLVQPGDEVQAGQRLVLLESMKTVLTIRAPRAGVVRALHCHPGDAVAGGSPLLELVPQAEAAQTAR